MIPPLLVASLAGLPSVPALAQDVSAIVKAADHYRMTADNLQVDTQVQLFNADGTLNKEHRYTVFAQAGRQSLVLM
ncbi:MAG: hypothetical protein Q7U45_13420, partial [Burkholderiaceae bacterium]|nr:hypothetical protein [Burkholderiaceae bacterium]